MKSIDLYVAVIVFILIIITLTQWYFVYRVLNTLKTRFPDSWVELGKPSLITNSSLRNNAALYSFLWNKKYLTFSDFQFKQECSTLRGFSIFSFIVGAVLVIIGGIVIVSMRQSH
jgi:hypothetical protein